MRRQSGDMDEKVLVRMTGGAPWGFRLQGGGKIPLVVHKIRPKSKCQGCLCEGDIILTMNGKDCIEMTYDQVVNLAENCGDELTVEVKRGKAFEKMPPSEIARLEGPLKRPGKNRSSSTAESYERSFKTADGFHVKETRVIKTSDTQSELQSNGETFGPVAAYAKVQRLPADIINKRSLSRSPVFDSYDIQKRQESLTKTSSTKETNVHDVPPKIEPKLKSKFIQDIKPVEVKITTEDEKVNSIKLKKETHVHFEEKAETQKWHQSKPVSVFKAPEGETLLESKKPNAEKIVNTKSPDLVALPFDKELKSNNTEGKKEFRVHVKEEELESQKISPRRPEVRFNAPNTENVPESKIESQYVEERASTEKFATQKAPEVVLESTYRAMIPLKEVNACLEITETKTKEESVPKDDHVTHEDVQPESHLKDVTTMPGASRNQTAPPLFNVTKFRSETQSSYSWNPSGWSSRTTTTTENDGQKENTVQINKRYSNVFEGKSVPPPPPPPKPLRPVSAPDLDTKFSNFEQQVRQKVCTPARRSAAEGEDRRSASLEMIKKALIPPSEEELKSTLITQTKKKMFSSSSFYEEPNAIYPTVREQFDLAKKIANSLSADTNRKSKGADMFTKRVQRSDKWIHESPTREVITETVTYTQNGNKFPEIEVATNKSQDFRGFNNMKPLLNPVRPQDSDIFLGTDREFKSQGLALSPDVCANLVQDLNHSKGKGAEMFARRRKKSEKWVVEDSTVPSHKLSNSQLPPKVPQPDGRQSQEPPKNRLSSMIAENDWCQQKVKYVKSPWEAALESPIGSCDSAFEVTNFQRMPKVPPPPSEVIKARLPSMLNIEQEGSNPAIRKLSDEIFRPKTPKGWTKSVHDPTPSELMGSIGLQDYPESDSELLKGSSQKFGNYNTLPRSFGRSSKGSNAYRPVRTSLYADL